MRSPIACSSCDIRSRSTGHRNSRQPAGSCWSTTSASAAARRAPSTGTSAAIALRPGVLWLTGERGAGKTALARWLAGRADRSGARVEILDDDTVGALFAAGGSRTEQDLRVRRLGWLAARLEAHGAAVV